MDEPKKSTPSGIDKVLVQKDFNEMLCADCGKKIEEHTLTLGNHCHHNNAVKVTYSDGRLYIDCFKCGRGVAIVKVAKE